MKKILAGLLFVLAACLPVPAQQWAFTSITATSNSVGVYSTQFGPAIIDVTNYPWAQSLVFSFTTANSGDRLVIDASNDSSFASNGSQPFIHFAGGNTAHSEVANGSTLVPVVGESWCVSLSAGRYIRLRSTAASGSVITAIVTLSPAACPLAVQQGAGSAGTPWSAAVGAYPGAPASLTAATPTIMANSGTTGAVTVALATASGRTTYLCGFDVSAIGGTAAIGPITIGQVAPGFTLTYQTSSSASGIIVSRVFTPCLPATGTNTQIVGTTTADGTATAVNFSIYGYIY